MSEEEQNPRVSNRWSLQSPKRKQIGEDEEKVGRNRLIANSPIVNRHNNALGFLSFAPSAASTYFKDSKYSLSESRYVVIDEC